jgi:hypothetical protein
MSFLHLLCLRGSENVRVEQVLAVAVRYFGIVAPGKKLMLQFSLLLVSPEIEKRQSFVVTF